MVRLIVGIVHVNNRVDRLTPNEIQWRESARWGFLNVLRFNEFTIVNKFNNYKNEKKFFAHRVFFGFFGGSERCNGKRGEF
jgi:hypothetical protein